MSVRVMSAVWELDLPAFEKLVLLALADCANDEGLAWPSIATLKRKTNAGERTVQRSLRALAEAGHLRRDEVPGKGCKYYLNPRHSGTPAKEAPAPESAQTPATAAPKPSRTIKSKNTEARAHLIPADWQPRDFGKGTQSRAVVDGWPPGEQAAHVEHFIAHHRGKGSRFVDWQDAWSTWVLNKRNIGNRANGQPKPSNDTIQNPYARVALARQAARASAVGGQPDSWP